MREILFRGKGISSNDWYYGDLMQYENGNTAIMYDKISEFGYECTEMYKRSQVDPETVGQFTGFCDKNGEEIFEGDIVKIPDDWEEYGFYAGESYEVYFAYGGFRLKPKYKKTAKGTYLEDDKIEVIGNIYDNPGLVK